ncbi:MAG: TrkH family potassium uptake protein [Geminicoccaceae bacterium]|nr:MAG: TrkH family potassium uptake protein [Geminicoccaceae bacterium]
MNRRPTRVQRQNPFELRPLLRVIGLLLTVLACFMMPPMIVDLVYGHRDWLVFLLTGGVTLFVGVSLLLANRGSIIQALSTRQAFILTTSVWVVLTAFAALPFLYADQQMSLADAVFEATSGITTTGSTVMSGLEEAPPGLLLWRSILQWLGGIGIIVMGVAVLPLLSVGGMQLFRTENSDRSDKILPRAGQLASAIGSVYLLFTLACAVAYAVAGMSWFDAINHAMTTVATGGYSTRDASMAAFDSATIEWIAVAFMFTGAIPFVLYIQALGGEPGILVRDTQVVWFTGIVLAAWTLMAGTLVVGHGLDPMTALRHAAFNTTSIVTGTGYATTDFGGWGPLAVTFFFFLMCVGGCTGSTTGGIKVFRFAVLYAIARTQILRLIQPSGVFLATYNGRLIPDAVAISVMAFFFLFALSFSVIALLLSALGLDYLTAMSAAITSLANVGPGLGPVVGPVLNFSDIPEAAKWIMAFAMLLGRLEMFTILVLLAPAFWRK